MLLSILSKVGVASLPVWNSDEDVVRAAFQSPKKKQHDSSVDFRSVCLFLPACQYFIYTLASVLTLMCVMALG